VSQNPRGRARERRQFEAGPWPLVPSLVLVLLFVLGGCTTVPGQTDRQATLSDLLLVFDSSEKMGGDPRCRSRRVSTTEVVGPVELGSQGVSGRWTERWTVERCGSLVPYLVRFARAADGDLDVSMQREKPAGEAATFPGNTIADPVLQVDAFAFLALRDFSETGAEGTCHTRKVIGTEMLQPLEGAAVEDERPIGGQWVERWTLDRCGMPVRYVVRFSTTQKGTAFTAERER
jgi:hypothetical protein